jgi:DNA modification methylase
MSIKLLNGDCRSILPTLPSESVHCVVCSPPYFGLRDYGTAGQIGLEATPDAYVAEIVAVFREVRRVLRNDGTLWLNLGDSYASNPGSGYAAGKFGTLGDTPSTESRRQSGSGTFRAPQRVNGLKPKDLLGIPWMVAFALRADGWYLRQDIIWSKPNPMPESVRDRCCKAHEYLFLLCKSARYHFDQEAISEGIADASIARLSQDIEGQRGSDRVPGKTNGPMKAVGSLHMRETSRNDGERWREAEGGVAARGRRTKRSVWEVATQPFALAHFATFPPALIEPCILAGCPRDGTVLDPFAGAGTTGLVADRLGRNAILIELNASYADMSKRRIVDDLPLFAEVVAA